MKWRMTSDRYLVTGALGCIGAWTVKNLIEEGQVVYTLDLNQNLNRIKLLLSSEQIDQINFLQGDISNKDDVQNVFDNAKPTHIIHLAALQLPFCKANPALGALVNVVGTVNIFEAVKHHSAKGFVYASSTAVYGTGEEYPTGKLEHKAALKPRSHYGIYKQANEESAKVYYRDDGISSIGLRPYTVYGAGRDQGMTSTPTKAMLAAAIGRAYHISYGGRCAFQYGDDMGKVFIMAARCGFTGAEVYNIGGDSVSVLEVIQAIESAEPGMQGKITFNDIPLPFPEDVDNSQLESVLGKLPNTDLITGVSETIQIFKKAIAKGQMSLAEIDKILQ